ncbi:hypothetical protein AKO1_014975 [Acrasis kona]|uniref:Coronin n=1 Tax=Acrasis kona TaxID=1008807 RepID=A0AAW2YZY3_9EUKA
MSMIRQSKVRHAFGTASKAEFCYTDIKPAIGAFDTDNIKANTKFLALPWQSAGGHLAILKQTECGRIGNDVLLLSGHSGALTDVAFHPFNQNIVATGSVDTTVKVWSIPEDAPKETITQAEVSLDGHSKKISTILFHPTANHVLATAAFDSKLALWDIETGKEQISLGESVIKETIQSMSFNKNGSLLAATCKDKKLRIIDPRSQKVVQEADAHQGTKGSRVCWITGNDKIVSVGFSKNSERHIMIWNPEDLSSPLNNVEIDVASSLLMPFYDEGTNMLYLAGKGEANVRFFEVNNESPYVHFLSDYKSTESQRGMCALPKLALDVGNCEVARLFKLENKQVVPISFKIPRRGEQFASDLFPDTPSFEPALSASEWFGGANKDPIYTAVKPGDVAVPSSGSSFQPKVEKKEVVKEKTQAELKKENEELKQQVQALQKEVEQLKSQLGQNE